MATSTHPARAPKPPFRADHVGSFLRPKALLDARDQFAERRDRRGGAARGRGRRDPRHREVPGGPRPARHHRRRVPPHLLPHRLPDQARGRRDQGRHQRELPQRGGQRRLRAAGDAGHGQGAPRAADPARRLRVPEVGDHAARRRSRSRRRRCCTSAAAAARSAARRIPTSRRSTTTSRRPTATSSPTSRRPAARTCSSTTPTSPTCATRRCAKARASRGDDPDELPRRYAKLINAAIATRPASMTACVHLCRGNFKSAWAAEGGYEPVAEVLFNELEVDGYFLEYDDARSGDFAPLRHVPKGKTVVLGLVSTKVGQLETQGRPEAAHRRRGEARADRAALPVAAVRLLEHRARQRHRGGIAGGQAAARRRNRARRLGRRLEQFSKEGTRHVQAFNRGRGARAVRGAGRGARHRQDRLHPADDRPAASTGKQISAAIRLFQQQHGDTVAGKKVAGHHQGRRRRARQFEAPRAGADRQRQGAVPRRASA